MSFARVGADDGLSQGAVMAIAQDRRGFIWLGTEDGLNRFDGEQMKHYLRNRSDASGLPNNWISALTEDAAGRLWIATDGGGLVWRDPDSGKFNRPRNGQGSVLVDAQARIRTMYVDARQRLWLATRNAGLIRLDMAQREMRSFRHASGNDQTLSDDSVFEITSDAAGTLWIATSAGLDRMDGQTGRVTRLGPMLARAAGRAGQPVKSQSVAVGGDGIVWVGTDIGLFSLDPRSLGVRLMTSEPRNPDSLPSNRVTTLLFDSDRRLWIGTAGGLALWQEEEQRLSVFRHEPSNPASLPDGNIVSMYQDRSGLLWIGTKTGGVARWNPRAWTFGHNLFTEPALNTTTSFGVDRRDRLWVGSFGGGVVRADRQGSNQVRYHTKAIGSRRIADDNVMALAIDDQDRVWLGTMGAGVQRIDLATNTVVSFKSVAGNEASLPAPGVMSLLKTRDGNIWVGTHGGGIARIDARSNVVQRYPVARDGVDGLSSDRATALIEDHGGRIWIGTDGGGLNVLDPRSGRFRHFKHDALNAASLADDTVYALHVDTAGTLWVGTRGGGLDRVSGDPFGVEPLVFVNFSEASGLANNTVYGIQSDTEGRIWLSTNRGIAVLTPGSGAIRTYRRSHGLQGDEFNFGAHYRDARGTLYFGGANGFNAFDPRELATNSRPPQIQLVEFLKSNTPAATIPESLQSVSLGFQDDVVTFRFAALDFTGPQENRYQYRLDGFDREWIDAGHVGQATYTNLDGGNYVLRVRAANSDGVWNEEGFNLDIDVAPPPWATWWAKVFYGVALVLALWLASRASQRKLEREAQYSRRLKAEVDQRTNELAERNVQLELANKQLREASITDPLTGLGNRRCLRDAMHARLSSLPQRRSSDAIRDVMMIVDLDFLKPINDEHGHDGGDAVLIRVAELLKETFRSQDLIVRWGGDEFVVLCRDCDLETAGVLAERVRQTVAKTIFRIGTGVVSRTSASIGFAPVPFVEGVDIAVDWEESLNLADAALYRAKKQRNTWMGWAGAPEAAGLPSIIAAVEADADDLERKGLLIVKRGPVNLDDTIFRLRSKLGPNLR